MSFHYCNSKRTNRTMNTSTPREEFEEWLETFYENSNILSPRSLAWEAWQASQKELTAAREEIEEIHATGGCSFIELQRVTEQRDRALQKIKNQTERITYLEGATNHATGTPLSKAIAQRDSLVQVIEAATILIAAKGRHNTMLAYNGLRVALQSITTTEP